MKTYDFKYIPIGALLIGAFYISGAFVLLISIFTNPLGASQVIVLAHGLSPIMSVEILAAIAVVTLVLAYGLIHLSRWGFILAIAYSLYIAGVSLVMGGLSFLWTGQAEKQIQFGNLVWSVPVVIYLSLVRHRFFNTGLASKKTY